MRPSPLLQKLLVNALVVCLLTGLIGVFKEAHAKSVLIVAIGADNVRGKGIGKRRTGGVPLSEAFPAQLEAMLHARGIDARVANAGVGGDTTAGMLARLDSAVPEGTRLVIVDRANGNDKSGGLKTKQNDYLRRIKARLDARHIAVIVLPPWREIPGATSNRAWDGHHFTAKGHADIARYLLPRVVALLGSDDRAGGRK